MTTAVWTDADPGVGDVGSLSALSSGLARVGEVASAAQARLGALDGQLTGVDWSGSSADAFRDRIGKLSGHLVKLRDSYRAASAGVAVYGRAVAEIAHSVALARSAQAQAQADHDWAIASGLDASDSQQRLARAQAQLRELAAQRRLADTRVIAALHDAHEIGMKNASGWSHFWSSATDTVTDWADDAWDAIEDSAQFTGDLGQYYWQHPDLMTEQLLGAATTIGGVALIAAGTGVEGLGIALDATGVGAVAGVPINIAGVALITAGVATTAGGIAMSMDATGKAVQGTLETEAAEADAASTKAMTERWNDPTRIQDHYNKHKADFGATTQEEYTEMAERFFKDRGAPGIEIKIESTNGVTRVFDRSTNTFGSYEPDGKIKSFYKPTSPTYWDRQKGVLQ